MNPQQPNYGQGPPPQGVPPGGPGYGYYQHPPPGQPYPQPPPQGYGYYQGAPGPGPGQPPHPQQAGQYQYPAGQHPQGQAGSYRQQEPYPPAQQYGGPVRLKFFSSNVVKVPKYVLTLDQPPGQQWQQPPPMQQGGQPYGGYGVNVQPTPASPGYDPAQKAWTQPVDTSFDVEALRKAMKGMGCDEKALIRVLTNAKYSNPWAMAQLVQDYDKRFMRDLAKDIQSETRGDLETALLALIRGPLENDVRNLSQALNRAGTDEDALMDVLLCRSNADIRAIVAEYKRITHHELLSDIKDDVDNTLFRLYSMVLSANRAENAAPVIPAEVDYKVTEVQRATEGTIGVNGIAVAQIFSGCNDAQIHALSDEYQRKYHRSLENVIEKEFTGDMEDTLLRILQHSTDRAKSDAERLRKPLLKTLRKDKLFINRVLALYWDRPRLEAAKAAHRKLYGRPLSKEIKDALSGDYEDLMIALVGKE